MAADINSTVAASSDEASESVEALQGLGDVAGSEKDKSKKAGQPASSRELSVATLVHLLGLPTMTQMAAMESSVDLMARKMQSISAQLEKISTELQVLSADNSSERVDFQLNEIRALLKRAVMTSSTGKPAADPAAGKPVRAAKILDSEPAADDGAKEEPCALAEFNSVDDANFQASEAQKVRDQMNKDKE